MAEETGQKDVLVKSAVDRLSAIAVSAKNSDQVSDRLDELSGGNVVVFGEKERGASRATRTEIKLPGAKVVIHNNFHPENGLVGIRPTFDKIEVIDQQGNKSSLDVTPDPLTSIYSPMFIINHNGERIGGGYGQEMDLTLAGDLLGDRTLGARGFGADIDSSVAAWILERANK